MSSQHETDAQGAFPSPSANLATSVNELPDIYKRMTEVVVGVCLFMVRQAHHARRGSPRTDGGHERMRAVNGREPRPRAGDAFGFRLPAFALRQAQDARGHAWQE